MTITLFVLFGAEYQLAKLYVESSEGISSTNKSTIFVCKHLILLQCPTLFVIEEIFVCVCFNLRIHLPKNKIMCATRKTFANPQYGNIFLQLFFLSIPDIAQPIQKLLSCCKANIE